MGFCTSTRCQRTIRSSSRETPRTRLEATSSTPADRDGCLERKPRKRLDPPRISRSPYCSRNRKNREKRKYYCPRRCFRLDRVCPNGKKRVRSPDARCGLRQGHTGRPRRRQKSTQVGCWPVDGGSLVSYFLSMIVFCLKVLLAIATGLVMTALV